MRKFIKMFRYKSKVTLSEGINKTFYGTKKIIYNSQAIPNLKGNEIKYLKKCIKTGYVASSGTFLNKFKKKISNMSGEVM